MGINRLIRTAPACRTSELSYRGRLRGYSLVEIVVVMAILAIVLAIGTVLMQRARANRELDASAQELLNAIKYARQMAISQEGTRLAFDATSYRVTSAAGQTLRTAALPRGVVLNVPAALNPTTFQPSGAASAGGTIAMTSATTGRNAAITLSASTGAVSMTVQN